MQIEIILAAVAIWLTILTFVLVAFLRFFGKLTKGISGGDLKKILEGVLATQVKNSQGLEEVGKELKRLEEEGFSHVQKVGLVRFNPFRDLGGDHSFSLAILDGKDSGVIITGLHTRERTRIYMKVVKNGKGEYELSEEERKALEAAQKS